MATRMLIDARHPEETRVAVLQGNRIEEFDFESAEHKQIKGNIYLAKVTRVEPSLQAAFVDFGGNRHGFLAFSEIHPDYYQIPKEDREALLAEEAAAAEEEAQLRAEEEEEGHAPGDEYDADDETGEALVEEIAEDGVEEIDTSEKDDVATIEDGRLESGEYDAEEGDELEDNTDQHAESAGNGDEGSDNRGRRGKGRRQGRGQGSRAKEVDEVRARRMALRRRYKIQDVIQRRQVLLVQVVKEERGNKGAALTTYLSLAGRYCVLMPNSSHGGGISRKISSAADRKRLKSIVSDLSLPKSMGLIVRTAGLQRTRPEIKRDFDYLARLWDEIRENTLKSVAPALIHSDSDLIKRAIRDIYNKEIEEVVVEGEDGYRAAREFMKLLMPSHVKKVKAYSDPVPLFQRYGAEDQLRAMYDPVVQLRSGGYLVINPTEALVSIDINSGRSTKEHGIEATALNTNMEAAREIARQLRLRDMAGLVVIDFIDMEYGSNVRKVEKAMKDALRNDRARIQVGRISGFGLMEMSRQRLRTGVLEATTRSCPHCDGTGLVRTASSAGLSALRLIEDEAARGRGSVITLYASTEASIYLLNAKRADLAEIEDRYGVQVEVIPEGENEGAKMRVASSGPRPTSAPKFAPIIEPEVDDEPFDDDAVEDEEFEDQSRERGDEGRGRRKRRRGGRDRGRDREHEERDDNADEPSAGDDPAAGDEEREGFAATKGDEDRPKKRRRRGGRRRRGRGRGEGDEISESASEILEPEAADQLSESVAVVAGPDDAPETAEAMAPKAPAAEDQPAKRSRRKKPVAAPDESESLPVTGEEPKPAPNDEKPKRTRRKKVEVVADDSAGEAIAAAPALDAVAETAAAPKPRRTRAKKGDVATADMVVRSDAAPISAPDDRPAESDVAAEVEPKTGKRGWWQRTFGE